MQLARVESPPIRKTARMPRRCERGRWMFQRVETGKARMTQSETMVKMFVATSWVSTEVCENRDSHHLQ